MFFSRRKNSAPKPRFSPLGFEQLEGRDVPSTLSIMAVPPSTIELGQTLHLPGNLTSDQVMVHFDVVCDWDDTAADDVQSVDLAPPHTMGNFSFSHTYTSIGTYYLKLTADCINEGAGLGHDEETYQITVVNPPSPPPPVPPPPPTVPPPPPPPPGISWLVNTTADTHDHLVGNGIAADANGMISLRAAIEEANSNFVNQYTIGFDPVVFPAAQLTTISPTDKFDQFTSLITINGPGMNALKIDGTNAQQRGLFSINASSNSKINHLTIANGTNFDVQGTGQGGGIANFGNLELDYVTVTGCKANEGGGIFQNSAGGTVIRDSVITSNQAIPSVQLQGAGGGLLSVRNSISMNNSTISGNQGAKGGGIAIIGFSGFTLTTTSLINNSATETGGGVYNSGGIFQMSAGAMTGNSSAKNGGGIQNEGTTVLSNVTLSGNSAMKWGGAIHAATSSVSLTSCTFGLGNTAVNGGGKVARLQGATVTATDCTNLEIYDYSIQ